MKKTLTVETCQVRPHGHKALSSVLNLWCSFIVAPDPKDDTHNTAHSSADGCKPVTLQSALLLSTFVQNNPISLYSSICVFTLVSTYHFLTATSVWPLQTWLFTQIFLGCYMILSLNLSLLLQPAAETCLPSQPSIPAHSPACLL